MQKKNLFINNVRLMMAKRSLNQQGLAKKAGMNTSQLSEYLSGKREPRLDQREKIAEALGISLDELFFTNVTEPKAQPVDLSKDVFIEIRGKVWATPLRFSMGMGTGRFIKGKPGQQDCFALEVEGDSMLPWYIPGDVVICRPKSVELTPYATDDDTSAFVPYEHVAPYNNRDAIILHEDQVNLKRIQIERKGGPKYEIWMASTNPKYPRVRVNFGDVWKVQAIVVDVAKPEIIEP